VSEPQPPKPEQDWTVVVCMLMIALAYVVGFWTHAWLLPWLRGEI